MKSEITVVVMTYNQKDYIAKTLESILAQKIDTNFDILVHDDCSEDGTYEIVLGYQKKFPNKIKIIHQNERKFLKDGFNMMIYKYVVPCIKSKYIAYCDGDDYWCNIHKLKKQYDFMETHKDYSMCFHSSYQLKQNGDMSSKWFIQGDRDVNMHDLINENLGICVATSSIFLKSYVFKNFPDWRKNFCVEDFPMYIMAAMHGKIHQFSDVMCVYRQFAIGSWSSQNKENIARLVSHQKDIIENIKSFDEQTNHKYHNLVKKRIDASAFRIAYLEKNFDVMFSKYYRKLFKKLTHKERMSLKLQYMFPTLYNLFKGRN